MRVGVTYPQTELGGDAGAIRAYGQQVEELGYSHILAYDHVVGADPEVHTCWDRAYDVHTTFSDPAYRSLTRLTPGQPTLWRPGTSVRIGNRVLQLEAQN